MQAEAQEYFFKLIQKPGVTIEKAKKLTKALYPACDVNKLKENPYGKVVIKDNPRAHADTYSRMIQMLIRNIGPEIDHQEDEFIDTHEFSFKPMHVLMAVNVFMSREQNIRAYLKRMRLKVTHLVFNDVTKTMEITFEKLGHSSNPAIKSFTIIFPGENRSHYTMELPLNGK